MKIALLFPPVGNLVQPYSSLPALTAFMRQAGHQVIQRDIGIEAVEDLINARRLRQSKQKISARLADLTAQSDLADQEKAECYKLGRVNTFAEYIVHHIQEAKSVLRDRAQISNLERNKWALNVVVRGMELLSAEYWPSIWDRFNFAMPDYGYHIDGMLAGLDDKDKNIFFDYFEQTIVPSVLAEEPDIVGISCTYFGQVLATLSLAQLFKKHRPGLHVCIGGAVISSLSSVFQGAPQVFSIVDGIVVGEGEHTLLYLTEALSRDKNLNRVPNLLYWDGSQVRQTHSYVEDCNTLPTPDYTGLRPELYLTPDLNVLLPTDRGCYWNRCAFCVISMGMRQRYRPRDIALVVEDMKKLHQKLGTRCFFLANDAIPPKRMKLLAQAIKEQGLNFYWKTETRLEKALTPETCRLLVEGGCRRLMLGIEACTQRVLDLMDKGIKITNLSRLLQNCHEAGIATHVFLMVGFPTETKEEARNTIAFVEANHEAIMSFTFQAFSLYPGSRVYADPKAYGVVEWELSDPTSLDPTIRRFKVSSGMNQEEIITQVLPEGYERFIKLFSSVQRTDKVISASQLPGFEDWDKSYLSWLAHHGVKHYSKVPDTLSPAPSLRGRHDLADLRLRLGDQVRRQDGTGLALFLFDPQSVQIMGLPPETNELLDHLDGRATVRQAADRFAGSEQGNGYIGRYYQAIKLCQRLANAGFLTHS